MTADDRFEPVFGPDGQPDAATLAGLQLGAFDEETTALIRARIAESDRARRTMAGLDALQRQLRSQPTPKMPDSVADRISAALRAEQAARAGSDTGPPAAPAGTVTDIDAARARRTRRNRWMGLAAAGVAVVAAGGIIYGVTSDNTTGGQPNNEGRQALRPGATTTAPHGHKLPGGATGPAGPLQQYSKDNLAGRLPDIVRTSKVGVTVPDNYEGPEIKACSQTLGQSGQPIAVQHASFNKQESYVFVFPTGTDHQAKVYVVEPTCTGAPIYQTSGTY